MIDVLVAIFASLIIYAKVTARTVREAILCILSTFIYWKFVGIYCILLPSLSFATWLVCIITNVHNKLAKTAIAIYCMFLAVSFFIFKIDIVPIYLPIGFSILCFSGISLVVDYQREKLRLSLLDIYTYLCFFPKILAGPIERYEKFFSQIDSSVSINKIYRGCKIIILCLFTKYIVVENLSVCTATDIYGVNQVIGIIVFAIQFYLDFWSYSFLAIGIALLYGINLSVNFNKPYRSKSFHEFWHRWNITLSTWLRDYIYIPLGGNRHGFMRYVLNVFIVFVVSAFWHDIAITFFLWGVIHAILLIIERKFRFNSRYNMAYTMFVAITTGSLWQLFRYNTLNDIYLLFTNIAIYQTPKIYCFVLLILGISYMLLIESKFISNTIFNECNSIATIVAEVFLVTTIGILTLLGMNIQNSSPFFYLAY